MKNPCRECEFGNQVKLYRAECRDCNRRMAYLRYVDDECLDYTVHDTGQRFKTLKGALQ